MSFKSILAYVDERERCKTLVETARGLGELHAARVIGLHVVPNVEVYAASEPQVMADLFESEQRLHEETASAAHDFFAAAMNGASCESEWREVAQGGASIAERVLEHGLVTDLIITGQIDPDIGSPRRVGTPEHVLMHGGRPQLMVPYIDLPATLARHVMIAWRSSGEAARAAFDALPLLRHAERVTILEVDPREPEAIEKVAGGEALASSLERHGVVRADIVRTPSGGIGIGSTILSRLADEDADLLVMGGYGHSRFSEYLFGGATREILGQMTVPVLISH